MLLPHTPVPLSKTYCVKVSTKLPEWLHPNTITLSGSIPLMIVWAMLAFSNTDLNVDQFWFPQYMLLLAAFAEFFYQQCDGVDGIHARRIGSASVLGCLFDHGCDCICTVAHVEIIIGLLPGMQVGCRMWRSSLVCCRGCRWGVACGDHHWSVAGRAAGVDFYGGACGDHYWSVAGWDAGGVFCWVVLSGMQMGMDCLLVCCRGFSVLSCNIPHPHSSTWIMRMFTEHPHDPGGAPLAEWRCSSLSSPHLQVELLWPNIVAMQFTFFAAQWKHYMTGVHCINCGPFGVTEAQDIIMCLVVGRFFMGEEGWLAALTQQSFLPGLTRREVGPTGYRKT